MLYIYGVSSGKERDIADTCRKIFELIEDRAPYAKTNAKSKEIVGNFVKS